MLLRHLFNFLVDRPMRYFYIFGHWRGLNESSVCASLSHYDADFWRAQPLACNEIISRQVHSFNVTVMTVAYFLALPYTIYCVVSGLILCAPRLRHCFARSTTSPARKLEPQTDETAGSFAHTTLEPKTPSQSLVPRDTLR